MSIFEGDNPLDGSAILLLLLQLILVVVLSRILTKILRYVKQPPVIAEIVGGIILGPSVMGYVPGFTDNIFPEASMEVFHTFAEVGLIFFMFLIGMEVDPQLFKRKLGPSLVISLTAMIFTFVLSLGASTYIYYQVPSGASYLEAILFTGVATAITAFPVLARILADQNLMQSRVGVTALSVAAIDDVSGWIALALVVSIAKSSGSLTALYTLLALLGYVLLMLIVVRPVTALLVRTSHRKKMQHEALVLVLMLLFASAWTTEAIGIHAIFGGFVMGIVVPRENQFHMKVTKAIEDLVTIVFLPLYFTYSGLRTKLEDLNTSQSGIMVILILAASNIGKIGGASFAARLVGHTCRESLTVGVLLNTKGLVELIVLNIGLDVGILTEEMFASFIVMALFNTFITTPLCYLLWTRWAVRTDPNLRPKDKFSVVMCVDEPASALAMVEVAAAVIHGQKRRKKLRRRPTVNALQLMEVSDAPSSYFFALRQKKSNALVFAKKHATLLGLNLRSTMRVSAHVTHDLIQMLNAYLHELVLLCWHPPHAGAELTQGRGILHHLLEHARAPVGALVYPGNFNAMNSVDNVLFVYRFERCEREAFQLLLSLLNNPQTKVTVVMPSRQAWERELMRQYEGYDDDDDYDDYDEDDDEDDDEDAAMEMDELTELGVSDGGVEPDGGLAKKEDDNENENETEKNEDDEVTQSEEERKKEKKKKKKREKCCPYSVGDFFDILFLLGLLKRGLVRLARALLQPCRDRSAREPSPLDEPASGSSAEDIEMRPTTTKTTTKKKKRRAAASKPESDSETDVQPATAGRGMSSSRSMQGISRMAEKLEEAEERRRRGAASKSDHEGIMQLRHTRKRRRKRAERRHHHPHLPWHVGKRRSEKQKLELEEDPERAWMSDMDDVLAQLNKHPEQVTIIQVNMNRLLEATLKEEKKKRAKHQRQLLLVGIDRAWDTFAHDQARWSAFIHAASSPSTFVLLLHPRLPGAHMDPDGAAGASGSGGGRSLRDRLLCCCCWPSARHGHQPQPPSAIDDEKNEDDYEDDNNSGKNEDDNNSEDENDSHDTNSSGADSGPRH